MKILVTGHKGFIGSNMMKSLEGHEVTGYEWGDKFPGYDYDLVMHFGAISSTAEKDVDKVMRQNYDFSVDLIENCNRYGIDLQYSSSASVYGLNMEFKEDSPVDPKTPYAWSKYMFERYAQSKTWGIKVQGFRYFNVYGSGEEHKSQPSPHTAFKRQLDINGSITLYDGSYNMKRDFVPVETVVSVQKEFINVTESGIWNIGTGQVKSFGEVAETFGAPLRFISMPSKMKESYQMYTCADTTKLRNTINQYNLNVSL